MTYLCVEFQNLTIIEFQVYQHVELEERIEFRIRVKVNRRLALSESLKLSSFDSSCTVNDRRDLYELKAREEKEEFETSFAVGGGRKNVASSQKNSCKSHSL